MGGGGWRWRLEVKIRRGRLEVEAGRGRLGLSHLIRPQLVSGKHLGQSGS